MMPVLAGVLGSRPPATLIIHDTFSGSGNLVGRTPDTVNNGNTWIEAGWTLLDNIQIGSGEAFYVGPEFGIIDCETTNVHIVATVYSPTAGASDDNVLTGRCSSSGGFPTDIIFASVEHDTDVAFVLERNGGVNGNLDSAAYNSPDATEFTLILTVYGSAARLTCINGANTAQRDISIATRTTGNFHGFGVRGDGSVKKSVCRDIKIYAATGIDYSAEVTI